MLFFNLAQLELAANGNSTTLVKELERYYLYRNKKLNGYYLPKYSLFGGTSFLINEKELFNDSALDVYKAQYIILAGKRDLNLYKEYKVATLDLSFFPDLQVEKIKNNPLLDIKQQQQIKFKYE
jgi:hypothetical protein